MKVGSAGPSNARWTMAATPAAAAVWGLDVATVTTRGGDISVEPAS